MNDRRVASILNEAKLCGRSVEEMGDFITEYFASNIDDSDDSAAAGKLDMTCQLKLI